MSILFQSSSTDVACVHRVPLDKMDNIAEEESFERDLLSNKREEKSCSCSSLSDFQKSMDLEFEDSFFDVRKSTDFLSTTIMDKKLGTTSSGIGCRFLDEEKTKKTKCRRRETVEHTLERKKRSFNRKPR